MIQERTGNIFHSEHQTLVNTVNCVGAMGAGIAYEFKLRYPDMYKLYQAKCTDATITIGKLWLYRSQAKWVLNFPTKQHWKYPTQEAYITRGLTEFRHTFHALGITSIAFPLLGSGHGNLSKQRSRQLLHNYLADCAIPIEIWEFAANAKDNFYETFKQRLLAIPQEELQKELNFQHRTVAKIITTLHHPNIYNISTFKSSSRLPSKTVEKLAQLTAAPPNTIPHQENIAINEGFIFPV